jgi:hypothetical protein
MIAVITCPSRICAARGNTIFLFDLNLSCLKMSELFCTRLQAHWIVPAQDSSPSFRAYSGFPV